MGVEPVNTLTKYAYALHAAIKKMKNNKTPETSGMTAVVFTCKALSKDGIEWLHATLNVFIKQKRLFQDLKESEILALCKKNGCW